MVNMKLDQAERKEATTAVAPEAPAYPYGLEISLDKDALEKLGVDELPEVGSVVGISGKAKVVSVHASDSLYGKDKRISLQITDLELGAPTAGEKKPKRDPSDTLYGTPESDNLTPVAALD